MKSHQASSRLAVDGSNGRGTFPISGRPPRLSVAFLVQTIAWRRSVDQRATDAWGSR
jgi:hypothetical protein